MSLVAIASNRSIVARVVSSAITLLLVTRRHLGARAIVRGFAGRCGAVAVALTKTMAVTECGDGPILAGKLAGKGVDLRLVLGGDRR